jgi:leader peptidase (prepilin peptidase)/N-methyltransferase
MVGAGLLALGLALATFAVLGGGINALAWACVQVVLVALAAFDLATRRLPNAITLPCSVAALALRALFERSELVEVTVAGAAAFTAFFALAIVLRGGFGMGDVKLAGMLGFLLGVAVLPALLIGIVAGGVASVALLAASRARLKSSIAYGPYLAAGGAVAILAFNPPNLV